MQLFVEFDSRRTPTKYSTVDRRIASIVSPRSMTTLFSTIIQRILRLSGIVKHYIRLLMDDDYQVNFLIKSTLQRCLQPKSERLDSKISTASEDKSEQDDEGSRVISSARLNYLRCECIASLQYFFSLTIELASSTSLFFSHLSFLIWLNNDDERIFSILAPYLTWIHAVSLLTSSEETSLQRSSKCGNSSG
jgi:hypothetical protein